MGLVRLKEEAARELSSDLRESSARPLRYRQGIIGLSMVAGASLGLVALYQMGIIRSLPEPPLPYMNANKVDASPEAYERFSMPDAVLGIGSYAATMTLAAMGPSDRAARQPWMPLALAAKTAYDVYNAGRLTVDQWTRHRAFCFWCLIAATATFATAPLVVPEARAALKQFIHFGRSAKPNQMAA